MIDEPKINQGINQFTQDIKEASIRKHFTKPKPMSETMKRVDFLYCDPPEVILQNVEKNKMYEVPVKIYNISKKTKSVNIMHPKHGLFKVDTDKKNKRSQIAPGMHLELLVIFETDKAIQEDEFDQIVINSENDFKLVLNLKAYLPQPLVQFEPLINLGFVPNNTTKVELIQFLNDGAQSTKIELKLDSNVKGLSLGKDSINLPAYNAKIPEEKRKQCVTITFTPTVTQNLHEKIQVNQITGDKPAKDLGFIEIIATSVEQQMSIVFEEGGGPQTDINFGLLYHGQKKECSAFLVNNGPREMSYKFFFHPSKSRRDFLGGCEQDDFATTPEEAGKEMTQRILSAEPVMGFVKPYSQIPIKFLCNTKIKEKNEGWRVTLCPEYDELNRDKPKNLRETLNKTETFQSLAAVKFEEAFVNKISAKENYGEFCQTISVYMQVTAINPDITIDKTSLNFWECNLKEKKYINITITNMNRELPIDFSFNKIPHFTVEPNKGIIKPNYELTIKVEFHPENIGKFADILVMKYVNNMYEIPIRIFGICKGGKKLPKSLLASENYTKKFNEINANNYLEESQLVPDSLALDFTEPKYKRIDQNTKIQRMHQDRLNEVLEKIQRNDDLKGSLRNSKNEQNYNPSNEHIRNFEDNFKVYSEIFNHKAKANGELVKMRLDRQRKQAMKHIIIDEDENINQIERLMKLPGNRLNSPKLKLPEPKDTLWVIKPIGQYEPAYFEESEKKAIGKGEDNLPEEIDEKCNDKNSNKTGEVPRTHQEIRECNMELSGEDLQKIQVSTKDLDMHDVFKNSEKTLAFWVKNNHRNFIFVKLEIDNMPDLQRSTPKSHVIAPGELQGFKITLFCNETKNYKKHPVKYTINYKHTFGFNLYASVIKVNLSVQKTLDKFQFKNDKLDKDKIDMTVTKKLVLYNGGNAPAYYKWDEPKEKCFMISPMKGKIDEKSECEFIVKFNPFESPQQKDKYNDELKINIENGDPMKFPVSGDVQTCNVKFVNLPNDTVDFEMINTGVANEKTFMLKNETPRVVTAYQIQNPYPEFLQFKEVAGYLAEKQKGIIVILTHKEPNPEFRAEIPILIRGGPKLYLKLAANIVQPDVDIKEDIFDFEGVTFNEPTTKKLTFRNKSKLPASVIVNLTDAKWRDFKLVLPEKTKADKGYLIKPIESENKDDVVNEEDIDQDEEEQGEESEEENKTEDLRHFLIKIPENQELEFDFIYCPNSFDNDNIDFETDFKLEGASDEYTGLRRKIKARKEESVISISEMLVKFPETYIYEGQKNYQNKNIKIGSVKHNKALKWEFLCDDFINEGVFDIKLKKGEIPANSNHFVEIEFSFTPQTPKEYKSQVVLKVTQPDGPDIFKTIRVEGEGLLPRLFFDKRELILPIVPLGFESSIKFKVKNKGYVNEEIRHEFESYPQGILPLELIWHDKNHSVGYNKSEIKCEVVMKSNKPITFTTKLIFFDKEGQQFPILVAGTCDNCLFTNYSFFQRTDRDTYRFEKDNESINLKKKDLKDLDDDDKKDDDKKSEKNSSFLGSSVTKNPTALLGYVRINQQTIEDNCKFIKKYIKTIHLDEQFKQNTSFKLFPEDVVKDHGKIIYILIKNLTGKDVPGRLTEIPNDLNERAKKVREQYCSLLRFLQEFGACLNTVFPEYLLDFTLYKKYIASDVNRQKILAPNWEKSATLLNQWRYYHKESWVLLVYQILKIFYLARVNNKSYAQLIKHLPNDIPNLTSTKFGPSNVYSQSEYLILKWIGSCCKAANTSSTYQSYPTVKDPITFSDDFKDSSLLTGLLLSYFPREGLSLQKKNRNQNELKMMPYSNIISTLKDYGIYTHVKKLTISPTSLPNAREMLLFLTMLYQNFQYFYPKETITFTCILGDSVVKAIQLHNPTSKPLDYAIKCEGNDCFVHPGIEVKTIEPNGDFEYPITFKSKFSTPVEGKVYFINRKAGWSCQAAPIVYSLISKVTERRSIESKIILTRLYSLFPYKFQVRMPFPKEKGEFEVRLEQSKKKPPQKNKRLGKNINSKDKPGELLYKVFFLKGDDPDRSTIKFSSSDSTADLTVFFLPIELDTYECNVIFTKENVGEFQYTIEGRVEKPEAKPADQFERTCNVEEAKEFDLEIKLKNTYLDYALSQLKPMDGKITAKGLVQKYSSSVDKMAFSVESTKPFYICPPTLYPGASSEPVDKTKDQNNTSISGQSNTSIMQNNNRNDSMWLKVKFSSKICMVYEGDIILTNIDKPNDIRVYKLYVDVKPKVIRATLEFFCPVKEVIVQKIPIDNKSDKDWNIRGELSGQTNGFFKYEVDKRIPKRQITDYLLTFAPTEKLTCNGILKLTNNITSETYYYTLIGNVEDPLAEGNIEITGVNAKETHEKIINIENDTINEIPYTVETDLDEVISGANSFTVAPNSTFAYKIKIRPLLGKIYFGRIIFRDDKKNYKWYTIRIEAKSQIQPQTIEMKSKIRKGVFIDINLENPTAEDAIFRVDFDSDLFLFGDKDFKVEANSSRNYQLLFAPMKVGIWDNVMFHIYNDRIGEFLYKLRLICEEQPPVVSDLIKAELGKYFDYPIELENPTQDEVEVKYTNSNSKLYQILTEKIYIPKATRREILVRYTPSSLESDEECILKFETKTIGKWEYHLRGRGVPPTTMEPTIVRTFVGGVTSGQINFKNPLNEKITVNIELKCDEFPDTFSLFNKKTKYPLEPFRILVIPFTFKPQILTKYSADLYVYISKTLFWKYPIEGITEVKSKGIDFTFKTKAKKMFETKIFLDLSNLPETDINFNDFGYVYHIKEEKYRSLINKCLSINFVDKKNMENIDIQNRKLPLEVKFYPLRPFKTDIEFILRKQSGGQWIYNIILEATEPDPDDVIHIKSALNKQSFVAFKLQNVFTKDAKFIAYFSHDSTSEFSVSPREGTLDQSGRDGSQFIICYLPVEYGKIKIGKLIIETDEVQWIFEVRGTHLDYKPPEIKKTDVRKLTKAIANKITNNEVSKKDNK